MKCLEQILIHGKYYQRVSCFIITIQIFRFAQVITNIFQALQ